MAEIEVLEPRAKKLKRMPHIFSQMLELPVASDAAVESEETEEDFRFVIEDPELEICGAVSVDVVGIVPGATKIVVRGVREPPRDETDTWRFRLPPSANPDASWATYQDGVLTVVVPKKWTEEDDKRRESVTGNAKEGPAAKDIDEDKGSAISSSLEAPTCPISVF